MHTTVTFQKGRMEYTCLVEFSAIVAAEGLLERAMRSKQHRAKAVYGAVHMKIMAEVPTR